MRALFRSNKKKQSIILFFILMIFALFVLSFKLDKKFIGHHDWNGVWYGAIARNHLRYGLFTTKLGSIGGNQPREEISSRMFFTHYPPLFPLILSLGLMLFGDSEIAMHLMIIPFSLLTIASIFFIAQKIFSDDMAFIAGLTSCLIPLFIYFGKMTVHEIILLPMILQSFYWYLQWFIKPERKYFLLLITSLVIAHLISWPAYFVPFLLCVHFWLYRGKKEFNNFFLLLFLPFAFFILHLIHVKILTGSLLSGGMVEIFTSRMTSSITSQIYNLNQLKIITNEIHFFLAYFTKPVIILSILGNALWVIIALRKRSLPLNLSILVLLGVFGSLYIIIFQEAAYIHDYLIYYLFPFIILTAIYGLFYIINRIPNIFVKLTLLFLFLSLTLFEQIDFTKALLVSNHSEKGYILGEFIKKNSYSNDKIFVGSLFYNAFFSPFISYYSERSVTYGETILPVEIGTFDFIIRPKAHDALDDATKKMLETLYIHHEDNNFIWYKPKIL